LGLIGGLIMTLPKVPNRNDSRKIQRIKNKLRSDKAKIIFILVVSVSASIFLAVLTKLWEREEPHIIVILVISMSFLWMISGFGIMFRDK
jgi:hypothetical protein